MLQLLDSTPQTPPAYSSWIGSIYERFFSCVECAYSTYLSLLDYINQSQVDQAPQAEIKLELLDPAVRENALKILNVTEAMDAKRIQQIYEALISRLEDKQSRVTPIFARAFERIIVNVQSAYQTLEHGE
jgi:hypothetical protein